MCTCASCKCVLHVHVCVLFVCVDETGAVCCVSVCVCTCACCACVWMNLARCVMCLRVHVCCVCACVLCVCMNWVRCGRLSGRPWSLHALHLRSRHPVPQCIELMGLPADSCSIYPWEPVEAAL